MQIFKYLQCAKGYSTKYEKEIHETIFASSIVTGKIQLIKVF